jgi:hypothetical protein
MQLRMQLLQKEFDARLAYKAEEAALKRRRDNKVALSITYCFISPCLSRAPASGPRKEGKVEGSQLRLYKAKEGSRKHEALHA